MNFPLDTPEDRDVCYGVPLIMASVTATTVLPLSTAPSTENLKATPTINTAEISTTPPEVDHGFTTEADRAIPTPSKYGAEQYKYSSPLISERAVDQPRPLKVIYIGAGVSGIIAAIKFKQAVPDLDLVMYEKNPDLGGTWYENRYPGCACGESNHTSSSSFHLRFRLRAEIHSSLMENTDIPSHSYQLSFESWTEWSHFFSGADEILEYWKRVAQKYDVRKHIRFQSRCVGARWNDVIGKWFVQIFNDQTGEIHEDSADVFMTGTGALNEWKWPSIPGLHSFTGKLLHSACWDERFDPKVSPVGL